jgi:uncharacterized protein (DUF58 family)
MLIPTRRALFLCAGQALLSLLVVAFPQLLTLWALSVGAVVGLLGLDALRLAFAPLPGVERSLPHSLAIGAAGEIRLRLDNRGQAGRTIQLHDRHPATFEVSALPAQVELPPNQEAELVYPVRPAERGDAHFDGLDLRLLGPLGLLWRQKRLELKGEVKVFPDFHRVARYAVLALGRSAGMAGVHVRRRGEGTEFHQLREHREGDSLRQIDWKAVSRRRQLVSREYREERDQQVVFLLDCGRRMRSRDAERSHFDHALDAMLLLSHIALRQGDSVGFITFSGQDRWLPPRKGQGAITAILDQTYDLQPTTSPSDYAEAAERLITRQKRRALVVILTNLRDDDASELPVALGPLRARHRVLLCSLREEILRTELARPVSDFPDALTHAALRAHLEERKRAHEQVRALGVRPIDAEPADLPAALVEAYMELKRAGAI